jgi:colanic acid/amylovoran biosynthesis protein
MLETLLAKISTIRQNKLFLNSFNLMFATGTTAGFGFLFWIIIAHSFHSATVGVATTLLSTSFLISLLGMAGFDTIFVRFLPKSKRKNDEINSGLIISGLASSLLAVIFCLLTPIIAPRLGFLYHNPSYLLWFVLFTVFTTWNSLTNAVLIAYRRTSFILLIDIVFSVIKVSLPLLIKTGSPMTIFVMVGIAQVVNVSLSLAVMMKFFRYRPALRANFEYLKDVARFGSSMYVANLLNLMPDSILPIIVIDKLGPSSAAYFYVTFAIANLIYTIAFATNQALLAEAAADEDNFVQHARKGFLISSALLIPTVIFMVVLAPFILSFFGHGYANGGASTLRIMAASGFLVMVYSFLSFIFKHTKNLRAIISMTAVNAVVILTLAVYLARYGLVGIGFAWLLGTACAVVVGAVPLVFRKRRIQAARELRNILVTHVYSEDNKGDAALLSVLLSDLRSKLTKPNITILTLDALNEKNRIFDSTTVKNSFMFYAMNKLKSRPLILLNSMYMMGVTVLWALIYGITGMDFPLHKGLRSVVDEYKEADLIIPVGGGYLRSQKSGVGSLLNVALLLHPFVFTRILGKPTILYAQSIGPFANRFEEKLVATVLSHCVSAAIIRENTSMSLLERIGVQCPLYRSIDSGFAFKSVGSSFNVRDRLQIPTNGILFGVTARKWLDPSAQEAYELAMAKTIEHIVQNLGASVVLIPQVTSEFHKDDDRLAQKRIVSHLKSAKHVYALDDKLNHHDIKKIYESLDYLIGTRFHSVIFSLTSYVPAIAIEYEHKTGGIMHDLDLEEWVIKMEDVKAKKLIEMADRLVEKKDKYRKHLKKVLPGYISRTDEPMSIVRDTFKDFAVKTSV